jgi:putative spermidine/putrescine transport system permease protein
MGAPMKIALLLKLAALLFIGYLLAPLVVIAGVSFNGGNVLAFPPRNISLKWYAEFLHDATYVESIVNSTKLALAATFGALLLGIPTAAALTRRNFAGAGTLTAFFMSPLIVPHVVLGVAILQLSAALGIARSTAVLVAAHVVLVLPYVIRMVLGAYESLDRRLEDASADLGASPGVTFVKITLPLIRPSIVAAALFAFVVSWTNVELSIFNAGPAFALTPLKIFNYVQYTVDPLIAAVSASTVYMAVVLVIAIDLLVGIDQFAKGRN